LFIYASFSGMI